MAGITGGAWHDTLWEEENPVAVVGFDFEQVFRDLDGTEPEERTVSFADMAAALSLILTWIQGGKRQCNPNSIASRALALLYLLSPTESHFDSLDEIGKACGGITRAGISDSLVKFRENCGLPFALGGKPEYSRETYSRSQKASVELGTHSSCHRKNKKASEGSDSEALRLDAVAD